MKQQRDPTRPRGSAKDRALRLLTVRWRSRVELRRRLIRAGFERGEVEAALDDLERAGLVDDARFAREVVADRAGRRLAGDRAVRAALAAKGVAPELVAEAMESAGEEADRALALARKGATRAAGSEREAAYRRLFGLLLRRGFGPSVAREACRQALGEILPDEEEHQGSVGAVLQPGRRGRRL